MGGTGQGSLRRTKALILSRKPFSESSDVVFFLTDERGVESALALGRRRPSSRLRPALEPLSLSELVLIEKGERKKVIQASLLRSWAHLAKEPEKYLLAGRVLGLVKRYCEGVEGLLDAVVRFLDEPGFPAAARFYREALKRMGYELRKDWLVSLGLTKDEVELITAGEGEDALKAIEKLVQILF